MKLDLESLTNEELGLFNPAICARLLVEAAVAYSHEDEEGMPYVLPFIILPVAFHPKSRRSLPRSVRTSFPVWMTANEELRVGFGGRARAFAPLVKAGIRLSINSGYLALEESLLIPGRSNNRISRGNSEGTEQLLKAARFLGRWFRRSGNPSTIFALFGVRP